uniref:CFI-box-CTERM domain-containing protein n=1 Tax=Gelidibacter sp. TaxID=2018083 RepID=UPI00404B892F
MKLNNKIIWISGNEFENGTVLKELDLQSVSNHIQATVYYKGGISEINNHFRPSDYIDKGYVCNFYSTQFGLTIAFIKFTNGEPVDLSYAHLERSKILNYEESPASDLKVVKKEEGKHSRKNFGRKAFAGASVLISAVADQFVSVNTHQVNGVEYKLYYQSKFGEKEYLTFYASDEHKNNVTLFLNTYYKKDLPEEAKKPIEQDKSNCFIATACYRDMFSPEVIFFRWYRDNKLQKTFLGRLFIKVYYSISPYFYKVLFDNPKASNKIKTILDKLFLKLK